ncbi:uncharacterized protein Z519_10447 [Cladophialophora bantiana CBS 173.52]|uniref:DUF1917 domain-containing protein n=1 Tax=Cladophialophora bantiana (strain ATCC 10958 / CBS 173.52 / CDC B-1940 / NIH 8579) TaxID=1442370 RepID=A0A0D2H6N2_CLAB1|nr:uncharacterized protein Z519_10447 [Cladophialophora bantiana CBS 173.52]KIW88963.1 hypothetical protein Z519_10447 [Cladophialophora bantiana CBS 173.52]
MADASLSSSASETATPAADQAASIVDDLFSDESDFHGSQKTKSTYNRLAASYNPQKYWTIHEWNTQVAAARGKKAKHEAARQRAKLALRKPQAVGPTPGNRPGDQQHTGEQSQVNADRAEDIEMKFDTNANLSTAAEQDAGDEDREDSSRKPQNFYEGLASAKQLSESVADFLTRLPPSTTTSVSARGHHWIWIANPYPAPGRRSPGQARNTSSNPESGDGDVATFRQRGTRLLEAYLSRKHEVEDQNPGKPPGSITRMLCPERVRLESDIRELAKAQRVTSGKWMLFPQEGEVDRVWAVVAHAVWEGKLGTAAKVATAKGEGEIMIDDGGGSGGGGQDRDQRLICVYTQDFSDQADIKRVLRALKDLGLLHLRLDRSNGGFKTIYYKCDAYTHLDLSSGNEYKLKASLCSSRDLFPEWYKGASTSTSSGYGR